jgi:rod shape-determining protein MreC
MEHNRDDFIIAIRSAFLKKGNQQRFSLLSLILFSIIFLILGNFNFKVIDYTKTTIREIVYTSSFIVSIPENFIKKNYNIVSDHFEHYDSYQKIKSELQELKSKDLSKQILKFENIELKKLINDYFVKSNETYGKVLIDKESPFLRSIIVNKGSKNNIIKGMIVYDDIYLIGQVVEVNYLTSRVLLISDINSKVPVTIQPLDIQAIMSGKDRRKGKLQYIKGEKLKNKDNKVLIVVTSGSGGIFKSGVPIGKINSIDILENKEIIVDLYRDFSQLKYVKIASNIRTNINLDQSNKKIFEENNDQINKINNQKENIDLLQQQKIITDEIRNKLEQENSILKNKIIQSERILEEEKKNNKELYNKEEIKFLELNLLYGHRCRKNFLKPKLYKVGTQGYKSCVLNYQNNKND